MFSPAQAWCSVEELAWRKALPNAAVDLQIAAVAQNVRAARIAGGDPRGVPAGQRARCRGREAAPAGAGHIARRWVWPSLRRFATTPGTQPQYRSTKTLPPATVRSRVHCS